MEVLEQMFDKLVSLLEEKHKAMEAIYDLTMKQKEDIEKNRGENLNSLIDKKQIQIDNIQVIDENFENIYEKLKAELNIESLDNVDINSYPQLKIIKNLTEKIVKLANNIMELEKDNKEKVVEIISDIKKDIKSVKLGQKSIKAYEKPNINIGGIYIDRKK